MQAIRRFWTRGYGCKLQVQPTFWVPTCILILESRRRFCLNLRTLCRVSTFVSRLNGYNQNPGTLPRYFFWTIPATLSSSAARKRRMRLVENATLETI